MLSRFIEFDDIDESTLPQCPFPVNDLLQIDPIELALQSRGAFTPKVLEAFCVNAAQRIAPQPITAFDLWRQHQEHPSSRQNSKPNQPAIYSRSLQLISHQASTIISRRVLSELCGQAGSGKTQSCLSLVIDAIAQGPSQTRVVYVDTERGFSTERLIEIASHRYPGRFRSRHDLSELAKSVHIFEALTCRALLSQLDNILKLMVDETSALHAVSVGLIIVDSIAAGARAEYNDLVQRQQYLSDVASRLKVLADLNVPVLVTNQVSSAEFLVEEAPNSLASADSAATVLSAANKAVKVALGIKWFHAVNVRFVLEQNALNERHLSLIKSPAFPQQQFPFVITDAGMLPLKSHR